MPKNFATQQDFLLAVEESLHPSECPPEIREALIHGVTQGDDALAQWEEQDNPGQELRLGRWFIRNDDFPFFQLLGAVAAGLVALAATSGVAASALVAPIANLAAACWQVKRKGATLTPEQVAYMTDRIPMRRTGKPEEIAYVVHFLASTECSFVTAQCYDASGGRATY